MTSKRLKRRRARRKQRVARRRLEDGMMWLGIEQLRTKMAMWDQFARPTYGKCVNPKAWQDEDGLVHLHDDNFHAIMPLETYQQLRTEEPA